MGAGGAGFGGQFFGEMMRGYMGARQQQFQNQMAQVSQLHQRAQQLFEQSEAIGKTDPDTAQLLRQAQAQTLAEADKVSGAKGPGAWKGIQHLFGFSKDGQQQPAQQQQPLPPAPAEQGPTASAPIPIDFSSQPMAVGTQSTTAGGPSAVTGERQVGILPPFAASSTPDKPLITGGYGSAPVPFNLSAPQSTVATPGGPGDIANVGGPSTATANRQIPLVPTERPGVQPPGSPQGIPTPSIYERIAQRPFINELQQKQQLTQDAMGGLTSLSKYPNKEAMMADPSFWQNYTGTASKLLLLGRDPVKDLGEFMQLKFPSTAMVPEDSVLGDFLYKKLGIAKGTPIPMTELPSFFAAMPKAEEVARQRVATLASGLSNRSIPHGGKEEQELDELQGILDPAHNRTMPEMWVKSKIAQYGPGSPTNLSKEAATAKAITDWHEMMGKASRSPLDHTYLHLGNDGYMRAVDVNTGESRVIKNSATGQPDYVGEAGRAGALTFNRKEGDVWRNTFNPGVLQQELTAPGASPELLFRQLVASGIQPTQKKLNAEGKVTDTLEPNPDYQMLLNIFRTNGIDTNKFVPGAGPVIGVGAGAGSVAPPPGGGTGVRPKTTWPPG